MSAIVTQLAVAITVVIVITGAIAAIVGDSYDVGDYLADLKVLVLALAAVLLALEMPRAVRRRVDREESE